MRQIKGISHIHGKVETEQRGNDILLWGLYMGIYGEKEKELLWMNPSDAIMNGCKAALAAGPVDLRVDGPPELEHEQYFYRKI